MFVVVSRRPEFGREWTAILSRWGRVRHAEGMAGVQAALGEKAPNLIVVDTKLSADAVSPSQVQDWLRQCGNTRLLLADTALAPADELAALAAGAVACCGAGVHRDDAERVVGVVLHGGVWVSKGAIPLLMTKLQAFSATADAAAPKRPAPVHDALEGLTERQREVAKLVGQGASNKQIARALDISDRTVKAHLTTIFEKLGVDDRLQLALHVSGNRNDMHP